MFDYFILVSSQVLILFIMMGIGYLFGKKKKFNDDGISQLTYLLLYIVTGCVIFNSLQVPFDSQLLNNIIVVLIMSIVLHIIFISVTYLFFKKQPDGSKKIMRMSSAYGNAGFLGIPLVMSVLGEKVVIYASVYFAGFLLCLWTHGVYMLAGRKEVTLKKLIYNPNVIALLIGFPLFLLSIKVPPVIGNVVSSMANLNSPVAMIVIGYQMSKVNLKEAFTNKNVYFVSLLKLITMPLITLLILSTLHVDPTVLKTLVLLSATPTAGLILMFANQYKANADIAALSMTFTTLVSIITLPLWAVVVEMI